MCFFKVIVPNYNSEKWINKCIDSILDQSFTDFEVVITDDMSTDNSLELIKQYTDKRIHLIPLQTKRYNGGSRNVAIDFPMDSKYTLFIDSDDWFTRNDIFQIIHDTIVNNNYPDCVSLSYSCKIGNNVSDVELIRNTPEEMVKSLFVACWTKCIKSELMVHFPENTLMEDVSQHIEQIDKVETFASVSTPVLIWNRTNENSCSLNPSPKRKSSEFRQIADLMDLVLVHDYCEEHRQWRINCMKDTIFNGGHLW